MSTHDFVLGTAGHIDHGKTTLVKALTGVDTDRLSEEKDRGITIVLGFAPIELPSGRRGGVVDVPGHERFVRTMIAGATGIDLALLVVAADEGVMPQTREHLAILDLLGVRRGVVAVTKADVVDAELLELACEEIADDLAETSLAGAPVVPCSGTTGQGIDELRAVLDTAVEGLGSLGGEGPFRLPVDRVFSLRGFGTIVTGTCVSGTVGRGDEVEILPGGRRTRVRGIEVHGEARERAVPSRRTALNLQGVSTDDAPRGSQIVTPGLVHSSSMLDVAFRYLESAPVPLPAGGQVRVLTGTAEAIATVDPIDDPGSDEGLQPGWIGNVQLRLDRPIAVARGDRVIVRRVSPIVTTGGGRVIDPTPRRLRRRRRDAHAALAAALAARDAALPDLLRTLVDDAEPRPCTAGELARRLSADAAAVADVLGELADRGEVLALEDRSVVSPAALDRYGPDIADAVARYHDRYPLRSGVPRNQLRSSLVGDVGRPLFEALLARVKDDAGLEEVSGRIRRRGFQPSPTEAQRDAIEEIAGVYRQAGLEPPRAAEIRQTFAERDDLDDLLGYLRDTGALIRVTEDLLVHRDAWDDLVARVRRELAGGQEMDPVRFKALTGLSRKFAIPILELLDRQRVTVRVGNVRRLRDEAGEPPP